MLKFTAVLVSSFLIASSSAQAGELDSLLRNMTVVECRKHDVSQENADRKLTEQAIKLMEARDIKKLNKLLPKLKNALDRAPDTPSLPEKCGDEIVLYSNDLTSLLLMSGMMGNKDLGANKVVQREPLPYAMLAYVVAWIAYENNDLLAAEAAARKGLLNDPESLPLLSELSTVLLKQGRIEDALAMADEYLAEHTDPEDTNRAYMLRRRGYALIELNRLDEAEAAYTEALKLAPDHAVTLNQLDYIRGLKTSLPKSPT